jgi:hypothetical protein
METLIQGWLSVWLYVMAWIAIVLGALIWKNRGTWSKTNILCTLAIIVLVLHVLEEWVLPGGLHYSYNITNGGTVLSCYPMNRLTDMITNFGGVVLGCVILKFWGFKKPAGISVMLFSFAEFVMHFAIGIQDMGRFGKYGMNILYSPGLITAMFGFLPIAIGLAIELFKPSAKPRPTVLQWIMGVAAMFAFAFLLISLPEMLLKDENSPYKFKDRGFYEQYSKQYELDNNYDY